MNIKNILVPYDGTASSKRGFNSALSIAQKYKAKLFVFTCIPEQVSFGFFKTKSDKKAIQNQKKQAEKQISILSEKAVKNEIPFDSKIMTSSSLPSHCIVKFVKSHKIDLIVMSTSKLAHGETMYYNSTVENVFRNAQCTILIIK